MKNHPVVEFYHKENIFSEIFKYPLTKSRFGGILVKRFTLQWSQTPYINARGDSDGIS